MPKPITIEINNKTAMAENPTVIKAQNIKANQTVGDVLKENGVDISNDYDAIPDVSSRITGVDKIVVNKRIPIHLVVNGNGSDIESSAETVENVLIENGVEISENDAVTPSCETKLTDQITEIDYASGGATNGTLQIASASGEVQGTPVGNVLTPGQNLPKDQGHGQMQNSNQANGVSGIYSAYPGSLYSGIANTTLNSDGSLDLASDSSYARPVDSANPISSGYRPTDLMVVGDTMLRKDAAVAFEKMKEAMQNEIGLELEAISGYRSSEQQAQLGSLAAGADYSEHQTGLAIDLGIPGYDSIDPSDHFESTPAYGWLLNNAAKYGFCLSMPENTYWVAFEPWHWRFLGGDLAPLVRDAQVRGECIQYTDYYPNHIYVLRNR